MGAGRKLTSFEVCAGAGGQAIGLHDAGFHHKALLELDPNAVATLKENADQLSIDLDSSGAPRILATDLNEFSELRVDELCRILDLKPVYAEGVDRGSGDDAVMADGLDLLAGGVPCPPFSVAGRQLGREDERDLFPAMLRLIKKLNPRAILIENVRGLLSPPEKFEEYRNYILGQLDEMGYQVPPPGGSLGDVWRILEACQYGVPQLRPRAILVAIKKEVFPGRGLKFKWPDPLPERKTVYQALVKSMKARFGAVNDSRSDEAFKRWSDLAKRGGVAPTLVGGSKKHGGADLGPSRAKRAWADLGVDAMGVANPPERCDPERDLFRENGPMLTVQQTAIIQGFRPKWRFVGGKTAQYRQVGNAFPPPVAEAVGCAIHDALTGKVSAFEDSSTEGGSVENMSGQLDLVVEGMRLSEAPAAVLAS